jgi:hypothetical protein
MEPAAKVAATHGLAQQSMAQQILEMVATARVARPLLTAPMAVQV